MPSNIFLKVNGAKGTSQVKGKTEFLEVLTWKWGMKLPADPGTDVNTHGKPAIDELVITKLVDNASGDLIKFLTRGKVFKEDGEVMLVMSKNLNSTLVDFLTIKFEKCVIASIRLQGGDAANGDRLTEEVALRFNKFSFEYQGDNDKAGSIDVTYDIGENEIG